MRRRENVVGQRFVTTEKTCGKTLSRHLRALRPHSHRRQSIRHERSPRVVMKGLDQRQRSSGGGDTGSRRQIITRHACAGGPC